MQYGTEQYSSLIYSASLQFHDCCIQAVFVDLAVELHTPTSGRTVLHKDVVDTLLRTLSRDDDDANENGTKIAFAFSELDCEQSLSGWSRGCAHPSARSLQFFRARLFRATSRLSRKGLLAVYF